MPPLRPAGVVPCPLSASLRRPTPASVPAAQINTSILRHAQPSSHSTRHTGLRHARACQRFDKGTQVGLSTIRQRHTGGGCAAGCAGAGCGRGVFDGACQIRGALDGAKSPTQLCTRVRACMCMCMCALLCERVRKQVRAQICVSQAQVCVLCMTCVSCCGACDACGVCRVRRVSCISCVRVVCRVCHGCCAHTYMHVCMCTCWHVITVFMCLCACVLEC